MLDLLKRRLLSRAFPGLRGRAAEPVQAGVQLLPEGLALATVRRADGGARLERCMQVACEPTLESRKAALRALVREHGLARTPTVLVMEHGGYQLLQVEAPAVPPEELRAAVRWQVRDLLDYHVDDAVIDVFDVPGDERPGRPMYVVAARVQTVQERVDLAEAAELELRAIDIPELALRNLACQLPGSAEGLALVRVLADEGVILVVRDEALQFARNVEIGASSGAAQLQDRLALEIQRSLDYYDSAFRQGPIGRVALAPFEGDMAAMAEHLHGALGLRVHTIDLDEILTPVEAVPPDRQAAALEAVGGALRVEERSL